MRLDENKILFIVHKKNEDSYNTCIQSIKELQVPQGKTYEVFTWDDSVNASQGGLYNALAGSNNAKYKVYLPDDTCFMAEDALVDMIRIFQADASIGMLGVSGARELPVSCLWQEADKKLGALYLLQPDGNIIEERYGMPKEKCEKVQCISNVLMATQYDWHWHEVVSGNAIAAAHSLECIRQGYEVVVPQQKNAWCLSLQQQEISKDGLEEVVHEYAPYLQSDNIVLKSGSLLGRFGYNVQIGENCELVNPGNITLYDNVVVGKKCYIEAMMNVTIGYDTVIEDAAYICDCFTDVQDGIPVFGKGLEHRQGANLLIGHHSHLERGVTVLGGVEIGCGCLIKANSTVHDDIPNHCVAAGNPARVIKALDYEDGKWLTINSEHDLHDILEKRKKTQPILTIGIPTYNRSYYLSKCLKAIYRQIGNDDIVEVFVSDNASTDNTPEIVAKYKPYPNLRYHRNAENIGSRNFENVWSSARGKYVVAVGDDDYFFEAMLYNMIKVLYQNQGISLMSLLGGAGSGYSVYRGSGMDDFISRVSYMSTSISCMIMNTAYYHQINDKLKFGATQLNQVYLQLELLRNTPDFAIIYGRLFCDGTGEAAYNLNLSWKDRGLLGKVFIKEYFDILEYFRTKNTAGGLSAECIKADKKNVIENFFLPWCQIVTSTNHTWKIDENIFDILQEYYADEAYYASLKDLVEHYLNIQNGKRKG